MHILTPILMYMRMLKFKCSQLLYKYKKEIQVFVLIMVYHIALFNFYIVSFLLSQSKSFSKS